MAGARDRRRGQGALRWLHRWRIFFLACTELFSYRQGEAMDRGLWRCYTRHPNYVGDATLWWGFGCFVLSTPASSWTLVSPLLMNLLIVKVSGVALLERGLGETKPKYRDYVRRTSDL